jgi:hypothetical protein
MTTTTRSGRRSLGTLLALVTLVLVAGPGCATAQYQLYPGPPRARGEIAVLWGGGGMGLSQSLRLWSVDGKPGPNEGIGYGDRSNGAFRIELEPGPHVLRVGVLNLGTAPGALVVVERGGDRDLELDAKPAGSYKLEVSRVEGGFDVAIVEEPE